MQPVGGLVRLRAQRLGQPAGRVQFAGQLLQVTAVKATAAGGDQAEDLVAQTVVTISVSGENLIEFALGQVDDPGGMRGSVQSTDPAVP